MANLLIIRDLCEKKKITIRELCRRVDRTESTIQSAIRKGSTNTATIELIAKELGVSPAIFFDGLTESEREIKDREIAHLKELLAEKERTIAILMEERKNHKK
ncbi:MAG: helix-turn-helix domain-containing protein [Bacteroidales bacterium]|nr:helix-turn-helix domain-containing protein [Bacteroidales bacterium]